MIIINHLIFNLFLASLWGRDFFVVIHTPIMEGVFGGIVKTAIKRYCGGDC